MLTLSLKNFTCILIIIVGIFVIITSVDSKNHLAPSYHKFNHQRNGQSMNYQSFNAKVVNDNDNSLEDLKKLFGVMQNKSNLDKNMSIKSTVHTRLKRNNRVSKKPTAVFSPRSCKCHRRSLDGSYAIKVGNIKKSKPIIDRVDGVINEKQLKRNTKVEINNNGKDHDNVKEIEYKSRRNNADDNSNLKIQLDNIYPDAVDNVDNQSSLIKLIRTKRFGNGEHKLKLNKQRLKSNDNIEDLIVKNDSSNNDNLSQDSKTLELVQDLHNLAQNFISKIAEVEGSMEITKRHERNSPGSSSLINSPKSVNQITRYKRCERKNT